MKRLLLLLLFVVALISCGEETKEKPKEKEPIAKLSLKVSLEDIVEQESDSQTGEVFYDLAYKARGIKDLIFVAHNADEDGAYVKMYRVEEMDELMSIGNALSWEGLKMPFGRFYITVIANVDEQLELHHYRSLTNWYDKAACPAINNNIYYKTFELELKQDNPEQMEKSFEEEVELDLLTKGQVCFTIEDWDKVPERTDVEVKVEISNIPSAFFIKTGEALSNAEHREHEIEQYGRTFYIKSVRDKKLLAYFSLLSNKKMTDTAINLGSLTISYNANGIPVIKNVRTTMPQYDWSEGLSKNTYNLNLYGTDM